MKKILLFAIIFIVLIAFAKAEGVKIIAKTEPFHNLILRIQNPMTGSEIISLYGKTNVSGTFVWDYDANINKLDFLLILRLFGETVLTQEFKDITVKPLITLSTINETELQVPANVDQTIVNSDTINSTNSTKLSKITENQVGSLDEEELTQITGFTISENFKDVSKKAVYILIAMLLAGSLFFIFKKTRAKNNEQTTFNDEINDVVRKLHEAEREIKDLRNKNIALDQAQKNFMQAREKWEKIRGYGPNRINDSQLTKETDNTRTNNPKN